MKHLVPTARQKQIKFLNKFPVYKKNQEANAKGKNRVSVRWCGVQGRLQQHGLVALESPWKNPFMHGAFGATPLESPRSVFH